MVDFSRLMTMTPEEREARNSDYERRAVEDDLAGRALEATEVRRLVLTEDPEIRFGRDGYPFAFLRSEREGKPYVSVTKPVWGEDGRRFVDRIAKMGKGDEFIAHGHEKTRRWTDRSNNRRSSIEFQIDVPLSPEALKHELPEGVSFPQSAFAKKQAELAERQRGISGGF
jgi:hypothetical protein